MHKTLKAECANPPQADGASQQHRFDEFRDEFNQQRPKEVLEPDRASAASRR